MTQPTLPPPVTDGDLDRPAVRGAARAVLDVVTADELASAPVGISPARRRPRVAVAAAAATIALGAGVAGYALTGGSAGTEQRETAIPAASPAQAAPPAPADVCEAVTTWLTSDLAGDTAGAEQAYAQLMAYRDRASDAGDENLALRIEAFMAAAQSGDRLAAETAASRGFGGDACA
jgi:hypothetical protein